MSNRKVWESEDIVSFYLSKEGLQKREETIFGMLKPALAQARVLDIGVGSGRTTQFLSAVAQEYVGIDYSVNMILTCQRRFRGTAQQVQLILCDARNMRIFADDSFDVVVFSYNGLDYIDHDDRLRALLEIRRVLRPRGWFVFSSHNLQSAPRFFFYLPERWSFGSLVAFCTHPSRNRRIFRRRALNLGFRLLLKEKYAIFVDNNGTDSFRLKTYYVSPSHQVDQLRASGFANVREFSLDGAEISNMAELDKNRDQWLYYLCEAV